MLLINLVISHGGHNNLIFNFIFMEKIITGQSLTGLENLCDFCEEFYCWDDGDNGNAHTRKFRFRFNQSARVRQIAENEIEIEIMGSCENMEFLTIMKAYADYFYNKKP